MILLPGDTTYFEMNRKCYEEVTADDFDITIKDIMTEPHFSYTEYVEMQHSAIFAD